MSSFIFQFVPFLGQLGSNIFPVAIQSEFLEFWMKHPYALCFDCHSHHWHCSKENGCSILYSGFGQASCIPGIITLPSFKLYLNVYLIFSCYNFILAVQCHYRVKCFPKPFFTDTDTQSFLTHQQYTLYKDFVIWMWFWQRKYNP